MGKKLIAPLLCLSATIGHAFEEDLAGVPDEIEEVVVLGTRIRDGAFTVGNPVSAAAVELGRIRPADPEQLFQRLPGFSVSRFGGPGGATEIFLRGAESNFTAVLVDGVRLNNPTNTRGGSFDFSSLGIQNVDRVDVSTGAMSSVYGADAMAGVIHIQSAWPDTGSRELFAELGSSSDWRLAAATTFGLSRSADLSLQASATDGGDDVDGSSLRRRGVATRLRGFWRESVPWEFHVRHVDRERSSYPEVSGGPRLAETSELERAQGSQLSVSAMSTWTMSSNWAFDLNASGVVIEDEVTVPSVPPGILPGQPAFTSDSEYRRGELLWVNHLDLSRSSRLVAGVNIVAEEGDDRGTVDIGTVLLPNDFELDRNVTSVFMELGNRLGADWTSVVAARLDEYDDKRRVSGKLELSRRMSSNGSQSWFRFANGFKLPSFFALGNPLFGNPFLAAEKSQSAEVGYTHVWGGENELSLSLFTADYDDLVDFDFETFRNVNRGRIETDGVEIRGSLGLADGLRVYIDGMWSNITARGEPLRRRPESTGGISVDWSIDSRWQLDAAARYIGSRRITSIPTGDTADDGYAIVNATLTFRRSQGQSIWLAIDNAFDTAYEDAPGFPPQGTRVRLGIRLML